MEYQIITLDRSTPLSKALTAPVDGGHTHVKNPHELKRNANIVISGKLNSKNFNPLLDYIKSLDDTAGHLFFPNQKITDETALSIAERSGKKVIFSHPDAKVAYGKSERAYSCLAMKDNLPVAFRCVRRNASQVETLGCIHEIPHRSTIMSNTVPIANLPPNIEPGNNNYGYFVDLDPSNSDAIDREQATGQEDQSIVSAPKRPRIRR